MARKQPAKKLPLEDGVALLRHRYTRRLAPPLEGLAYRFSVWLPVQARGKPVFSAHHRICLEDLFHDCFAGYSQSTIQGFPPWSGSWLPAGAEEPVVDHHIILIVYALQDTQAIACMQHLKWLLQQEHVAAQEVVLIEQVPVQFVEAAELA